MRRVALILLLALLPLVARAQVLGPVAVPPGSSGGSGTGIIQLTGDCAAGPGAGTQAITCTKTNGTLFAPSATTDTTNASNISSGILAPAEGGTGINNNTITLTLTGATAGDCLIFGTNWTPGVCPGGTGGGNVNLNSSALIETLPNSATGTGNNLLVVYTNGAQVKTAATTDTTNVIGICVSGITGTSCGTTGNASIAISGQTTCVFDGATTAGDFVVASTTVAGDCHDTGSGTVVPGSVQVIGYAQSTNANGGTYSIDISDMGIAAALSKKAQPGGSNGQLQYNNNGSFGGATLGTGLDFTGGVLSATIAGANPTATAGPTAVNGVATTYMRSDASPAVQKGSSGQFGIVECDGTTVTCPSGILTAVGGTTPGGSTNSIQYNNAGAFGGLSLTNGQLLIGSTGAAPMPAALTAGANVTITPGAGSITIAAIGGNNPTVNTQTASYTLALGDANNIVAMNVATANNLTVPPHASVAIPVNSTVCVRQIGAGQTTFVAGAGVTIHTPETLLIQEQWGQACVYQDATDDWWLEGRLQPTP